MLYEDVIVGLDSDYKLLSKELTADDLIDDLYQTRKRVVFVMGKGGVGKTTYGFALHHYYDDNIRITIGYDIVQNEKVGTVGKVVDNYTTSTGAPIKADWSNIINQNVLTIRIQAKF